MVALGLIPSSTKLGKAAQVCDPSSGEVGAGEPEVQAILNYLSLSNPSLMQNNNVIIIIASTTITMILRNVLRETFPSMQGELGAYFQFGNSGAKISIPPSLGNHPKEE